jgi:hypothetical protein
MKMNRSQCNDRASLRVELLCEMNEMADGIAFVFIFIPFPFSDQNLTHQVQTIPTLRPQGFWGLVLSE